MNLMKKIVPAFLAAVLALGCARPSSDEAYSLLDGGAAEFRVDMADSLKYSLEAFVYGEYSPVKEPADSISMFLSFSSPSGNCLRDTLLLLRNDVVENRPAAVAYHRVLCEDFTPSEFGEWVLGLSFGEDDLGRANLLGAGLRLKRGN